MHCSLYQDYSPSKVAPHRGLVAHKCSDPYRATQCRAHRVAADCRDAAGMPHYTSANKGLPLPLGRGVCETKSKNGRSIPRKPFISRVFCAQRGIETMVSQGARPWGRGRSGDCENSPVKRWCRTCSPTPLSRLAIVFGVFWRYNRRKSGGGVCCTAPARGVAGKSPWRESSRGNTNRGNRTERL